MERFTCRTCLSIADGDATFKIFEKCSSKKTIKDALLEYVPAMEKTLSEKDRICKICLNTLKIFLEFLDKCLDIEENLLKDHATVEKIVYNQNSGKDVNVVENIQIVLDEELKPLFNNPSTSTLAPTGNINHDHSYVKPDISLVKVESMEEDEQDSQSALSSCTLEQDDNDEMNEIQYISLATISDEDLSNRFGEASTSTENSLIDGSNVTVLASGDEIIEPGFIQIKEESTDSLIADCEGIAFYQPLSDESNIYVCELCGDGFLSANQLQEHFLVHGELRIMCDKCPKIFKNDSALKAHYKLKHIESEKYKCDNCGQVFARADYLRNHLKRHEADKKNNLKCRVPGKFLRFKNTDDPLLCKICGKYYNGIQKLKIHLQTHLVVRRFACEYCDLTYKRWPSLKRHEKTHLEADTFFYRCNVCWKRFIHKEELDLHMNQHGNPRYRCQVCNEQFHRKYLFDNHYLLSHATPEDIENSKKEVIYDTLLELSTQNVIVTE